MALTAEEQKLYDFALSVLPPWYKDDRRSFEFEMACAKLVQLGMDVLAYWFEQSLITESDGPNAVDPDWLNQHARDRGTARQNGESDAELRTRLRNVEEAVTRPALLSAADNVLANSTGGNSTMVELPAEGAFAGDTGDTLAEAANRSFTCDLLDYPDMFAYRVSNARMGFIIILPSGTSDATAASVDEEIRETKAAGFWHQIEVSP